MAGRAPAGQTAGGELRPLGASWPGLAALPAPAGPGQSEADIGKQPPPQAAAVSGPFARPLPQLMDLYQGRGAATG